MGTRLYVEFTSPAAEAWFWGVTPKALEAHKEEIARWEKQVNAAVDTGDQDLEYKVYVSLIGLSKELYDFDTYGFGRIAFDPEKMGYEHYYAGKETDPEKMLIILREQYVHSRYYDARLLNKLIGNLTQLDRKLAIKSLHWS